MKSSIKGHVVYHGPAMLLPELGIRFDERGVSLGRQVNFGSVILHESVLVRSLLHLLRRWLLPGEEKWLGV